MTVKRTMTLNLSSDEMAAVESIAQRKDVTKTAIIKQAIRLYLLVDTRLGDGDKLFVEDDEKQKTELAVL
jgi:predicted transcriptional regulator